MSSNTLTRPNSSGDSRQRPQREQRRGYRRHPSTYTTLTAYGEPLVWLTGGALILAIVMIVGVLAPIIVQGAGTFWPLTLKQIQLTDGHQYIGEFIDSESVPMTQNKLNDLSSFERELFSDLEFTDKTPTQNVTRWKFRGSDEATGNKFSKWFWSAGISEVEHPEWAAVVERANNSRLFGELVAFSENGTVLATDSSEAWQKFNEHHAAAYKAFLKASSLHKHDIGALDRRVQAEQLAVRRPRKNFQPVKAIRRSFKQQKHPSPKRCNGRSSSRDIIQKQIDEQEKIASLYKLHVKVNSGISEEGRTFEVPIGSIVRVVTPNRIGWFEKVGTYISRWWEF